MQQIKEFFLRWFCDSQTMHSELILEQDLSTDQLMKSGEESQYQNYNQQEIKQQGNAQSYKVNTTSFSSAVHSCIGKNCAHCKAKSHSASAANISMNHQRSKSDINSALTSSQINKKKVESSFQNTQIKFVITQKQLMDSKSHKVSPNSKIKENNPQQKQKITNIQIDLSSNQANAQTKANIPHQSSNTQNLNNFQRSYSKPVLTSHLNNSNNMFYRKDSLAQAVQKKKKPSPAKFSLSSQPSYIYMNDSKSTTQIVKQSSSLQTTQQKISQQNSPTRLQYQKSTLHVQYFKPNQLPLSPNTKCNSFVQAKYPEKKTQYVDISDDVSLKKKVEQIKGKSMIQIQNNGEINPGRLALNFYEKELVCEDFTNDNNLKSNSLFKLPVSPPLQSISYEILEAEYKKKIAENKEIKSKQQNLFQITDQTENQILDSNESMSQIKQSIKRKFRQQQLRPQQINMTTENSQIFQTTELNMSPQSKDVFKLKRLIKRNFKKFNEPPTTTSEFYKIGRIIGKGAFGKVNLAAHKLSEQLVAIKSISKEYLKNEEDQKKKIMQEVGILKQSNHPSIARLFDSFETKKHICFVMELCSGGDLLTYVRKRRKLKEDVAKYFFKQIIEGLAYIHHSKLIVHRDIKLDNILLDVNGKIKICDFGVSKQLHSENQKLTEQCGTPAYIAPEILKDKGYEGFKVDVWSAGVCLYAMLLGSVPFKGQSMHELQQVILQGKYEIKEDKLTDTAVDLIKKLLIVDPKKRLSVCEILNHPWLKDSQNQFDVFTQKEKDVIKKEYLARNIDKQIKKEYDTQGYQDIEPLFTEHNLDTLTNCGSLLKNASTKSMVLAPFNSTLSNFEEGKENNLQDWPTEVRELIVKKNVVKFSVKCRDANRQYEQNNNADLDNGVYNDLPNETDKSQNNKSKASDNSDDSLKKSFKVTELSSDDEKADQQLEDTYIKKYQHKSELIEFENQIKMKYVRYQEPVHQINQSIIDEIFFMDIYPSEYILQVLDNKEMNYASAAYFLLFKKKELQQLMRVIY